MSVSTVSAHEVNGKSTGSTTKSNANDVSVCANKFNASAIKNSIVDTHVHVWTADPSYPISEGALAVPPHLAARGNFDELRKSMVQEGVRGALIVQPVNYGQDYSYLTAAYQAHPEFYKGMFVADPGGYASSSSSQLKRMVSQNPHFWVGVRFNPYLKWESNTMACELGKELFKAAGELNLPVGFMPFKGLHQHVGEIKALMAHSPATQVIIDHWGFILQPALGFGDDRTFREENFADLLALAAEFPQVHVKISGMFRNVKLELESSPSKSSESSTNEVSENNENNVSEKTTTSFGDLAPRFEMLLKTFGSRRILYGSDAPYLFDFGDYNIALDFLKWEVWKGLSTEDQHLILWGNAERLFGPWGNPRVENDENKCEL